MIPSNVALRVGVSPGGCKQNDDCNIGLMNLIGSCSQIPLEQSTKSQILSDFDSDSVTFVVVHSNRMLRRMFGEEEVPPPPANSIREVRRERRTRRIHDSKNGKLCG